MLDQSIYQLGQSFKKNFEVQMEKSKKYNIPPPILILVRKKD